MDLSDVSDLFSIDCDICSSSWVKNGCLVVGVYSDVPPNPRESSMVMKKDIFVGQLEKIFKDKGGKLLESYEFSMSTKEIRSKKDINP